LHKIGRDPFRQQGREFSRYIEWGWGKDHKNSGMVGKIPSWDGKMAGKIPAWSEKRGGEVQA
jgi:hypothetical protein